MVQIVNENFPDEKYYEAVRQWRLPFWDYFRPRGGAVDYHGVIIPPARSQDPLSIDWTGILKAFKYDCGVPDIFTIPALMVRTSAEGDLQPTENPFFRFSLKQEGGLESTDFNARSDLAEYGRNITLRWPLDAKKAPNDLKHAFDKMKQRSTQSENPETVTDALNTAINWARESNIRVLWSMMNDASYAQFSEFGSQKHTKGASGNLEGTIHGGYHDLIGGPGGHMGTVPLAGKSILIEILYDLLTMRSF
jgi:tyrosinase